MKRHDIVGTLLSFTQRERFERIPKRVRALAKIHIIDSVGAMLAGARSRAAHSLRSRLFAVGCGSGSDVVGTERTLDPPLAAFVNAFCARVLMSR